MPKIICTQCKAIEDVDVEPASVTAALCSKCAAKEKSKAAKKQKRKSSPQRKHGTRVMLPITCVKCGQPDTLDYVPKGADLDDVLCRECAKEAFDTDSDWARIERKKQRDAGKEWAFDCDECGRTDYVPFEPKEDRTYLCNLCRFEHDTPKKERIAGREKTARGVFIRRKNKSED